MTKAQYKKQILGLIVQAITKDDGFRYDEDDLEGPDYDRWNAARNELAKEFERRARGIK